MSDFNIEDYAGLADTGFGTTEPIAPEDEFFHSLYIAGQTRKNHIGKEEIAGKIQLRGVDYNFDTVHMIITNIKEVLAKNVMKNNRESLDCFSFKTGDPWKGTSGRVCGTTSAERANNEFCNTCRSQIIVSGIYCEENGKPIVDDENKPIFIFIRARGMKYSNVSSYLNDLYQKDLEPIFTPVTPETKEFEKKAVNNKRFVTIITVGEAQSNYGVKKVFDLKTGVTMPNQAVVDILKLTKKSMNKFNEKFDWSLKKTSVSGYGDTPTEGVLSVDGEAKKEEPKQQSQPVQETFSFDDIEF